MERNTAPESVTRPETIQNKPTRLYIVRHAESEANVGNIHIAEPNLTDRGVQQARALGRKFAQDGIHIDAVVTSGSARATQTAEGILEQLGIDMTAGVNRQLKEKREGKFVEEKKKDILKKYKEILQSLPDKERWDFRPEVEGLDVSHFETERETANRMKQAMAGIVKEHPQKTVLVVSHNMSMNAFLSDLQERGIFSNADAKDISYFLQNSPKNTGYVVLDATIGESGLERINMIERNLRGMSDHDKSSEIPKDQSASQVARALQRVRDELKKYIRRSQ